MADTTDPSATFGVRALLSGTLDLDAGVITHRDGAHVRLTRLELKMLRYLDARAGQIIPAAQLHADVWGHASRVISRAVDNTASRLRKKIERPGESPRHLIRIPNEGFVFRPLSSTPAAAPAPMPPATLPPRDAFFGRRDALIALDEALASAAVVTVSGPGGIGKTRLIREAPLPGAIWVDAAGIDDGEGLDAGLASALAVPEAQLDRALQKRAGALIVIDNVEHLAAPLRARLLRWRRSAPSQRWLLTSRAVLGLADERLVRLGPLAPEDAVSLLIDRAQRRRAGWGSRPRDITPIQQIVSVLEGWPLAIELAAARATLFTPRALLDQLQADLDPDRITARLQGAPPRQSSLGQTLRWSWSLLSAPAQRALSQLAIFEGGLSINAALAVLPADGLSILEELIDQSMVTPQDSEGDTPRFSMLEAIRRFALRVGDPEELAETRRVAARHFSDTFGGESNFVKVTDRGDAEAEHRIQLMADFENIRLASLTLLRAGSFEASLWLGRIMLEWCNRRRAFAQLDRIAGQLLALCPPDCAASQWMPVRILRADALAYSPVPHTCFTALAEIIAESDQSGDLFSSVCAGILLLRRHRDSWDPVRVRAVADATMAAAERYAASITPPGTPPPPPGHYTYGDLVRQRTQRALGAWEVRYTDTESQGRERIEGALAYARYFNTTLQEAICLMDLSVAATTRKDVVEAARLARRAATLADSFGVFWPNAAILEANALREAGRPEDAWSVLAPLQPRCERDHVQELPELLLTLSAIAWDRGHEADAALLLHRCGEELDRSWQPRVRARWHLERARQAHTRDAAQREQARFFSLIPDDAPLPAAFVCALEPTQILPFRERTSTDRSS
ncbi:MAG: winged helix-turn-helix domain-containing protein [Myxococcota bacterium]